MNATSTPTTIEVCVDCLMWLANGDTPNEDQGGCVDHWEPPQGEITLGATDCELCIDGQETLPPCEEWFSWRSCDACGCPLGGSRSHATIWTDA